MATAGTILVNLVMGTAGLAAGVASSEKQFEALRAQIGGVTAGSIAGSAAAKELVAAQTAAMKAAYAEAVAQEALAKIQTTANASTNSLTLAKERLAIASQGAAAAQVRLAEAEAAAKAPATGGFPLISGAIGLASLAIVAFGDEATKAAAKYQYDMELIQTQTGGTREEVESMKDAILGLAPSVQAGPDALAQALYHIESVGIRGAQALDTLKVAAQGAAVGNADLETVANALVAVVKSGIAETMSLSTVMGVLNGIVGTGNIRMQDLAASFSSGVLSTARQFGLSLQDVGAAMATMADQGIPAEEAATRLRITIALLGAPTKIATSELAKIGLTQRSLADEMRGPQGLVGALILLKAHMDQAGLDATEQSLLLKTAFGGSRSSAGILTLINSLDLMGQKLQQISSKSNSFAADFAAESATSEAQFRNFGAAIEVLKIKIGEGILPVVNLLIAGLAFLAQQTLIVIPLFSILSVAIGLTAAKAGLGVIKELVLTLQKLATVRIVEPIMATGPVIAYKAALEAAAAATADAAAAEQLLQEAIANAVPGMSLATGATLAERDAQVELAIAMAPTAAAAAEVAAADELLTGAEATATAATTGLATAIGVLETAIAVLVIPIGIVVAVIAAISAALGGFDKFMDRMAQGVRAVEYLFFGFFKAMMQFLSAFPIVGDAAKAMADKLQAYQNQLTADLETGYQVAAEGGAKAGIGGITGMINAAEQAAQSQSGSLQETMIQMWGSSLAGVEGAAATSGTKDMLDYATAIKDARDAPLKALQDLMSDEKTAMSDGQEIARLMGALQGKALADGLASSDPVVASQAEATKKSLEDRLNQITDFAYMAGSDTGKTWADAMSQSMLASGSTQADVDQAINNILYDPEKLAAANAAWSKAASTWKDKLAPSIGEATKAYQDFLGSLNKQDASQVAAGIVASIGTNVAKLAQVGETAGSDVMLAVAKGIKEKQDAPLNALKDLHNALKNQFDRNREIALLWGEMTSKDLARGLKSQDPYVRAQAIATQKIITDRLDELTGGAYSASLTAGTNVGRGLSDAAPVVGAGAQDLVAPLGTVLTSLSRAGGAAGDAAGETIGIRLAEKADAVAHGTALLFDPFLKGGQVILTVSKLVGDGSGESVAIGLAEKAGAVAAGVDAMLTPVATGFRVMVGTAYIAGKAIDDNIAAGMAGGSAVAPSFAEILANALKHAGSQAGYLKAALDGVGSAMSNIRSQATGDMTSAFDAIKEKATEFFDALHQKNLQAIKDSHDQKNALLDAKEALNQAPVTAAQKALDFQRSAQEEYRLRQAVATATDPQAKMEAVQALQDFLAQKHIDMMQGEVDAANKELEAQKKANDDLEKQQEDAENKRYEAQKKSFDQQLAALERYLKTHPKMWKKANAEIQALLKSFGIDYLTAGALLGSDFVKGLWAAVADADKAAKALAKAGSGGGTGTSTGSGSTYRPPAPPPKPPPAPATQPVVKPIGSGGGPVAYGLGAWDLASDTMAQLHAREMVVPPDTAAAIRRIIGGRGFSAIPRLLADGLASEGLDRDGGSSLPTSASARARQVHLDISADTSPRREGGGGTMIVKIGEHTVAEITDRNLYVQESIYGGPRTVDLRSSR